MATAPQIAYLDGAGHTANLSVTTNAQTIFLHGSLDANTVDVQIDVNGSGFASDPTLVGLDLPRFTVPNPRSIPSGLHLERGTNVIRLRSIDVSGSVSPVSVATITVAQDTALGDLRPPPTGVELKRRANAVELTWSDESVRDAVGFNVYASTGPGGTGSGYLRLNAQLIPISRPVSVSTVEYEPQEVSYDWTEDSSRELDLAVTVATVSSANGQEAERKTQNLFPLIPSAGYRLKIEFSKTDTVRSFSFIHDRSAGIASGVLNSDTFSTVPDRSPIYYVVTAVYYDRDSGVMQESKHSLEMSGSQLPLDANIRGIRIREQSAVVQDYIKTVQANEPELSLIPGSTVREVHIEPFANEIQKAYFLMDFVHRARSFPALLAVDDPNLTGTSVPVASSQYKMNLKTALALTSDAAVQALIDSAFDQLAANLGVARDGRTQSTVVQTFYTTTRPTRDLYVTRGAVVKSESDPTVPRFITKGQSVIPAAAADRYYNPAKRRYEIQVQMVAETAGTVGNVPAGSLDSVVSGASGLSTVNESSAFGGSDVWSNLRLAEAGMRALSSLDTGTAGGYESVTSRVPGVQDFSIVRAGDPCMMRDFDPIRRKHIGGKVDIYVKGTVERTVQETFAFQFDVAKSVRFEVIDPVAMVFRALDSRLSPSNPIQEMLSSRARGFGLRNHSSIPTTAYDLTGASVVDYRTVRLNTLIPQPETRIDDYVEGDYRYRSNNRFVPSVQPVRSVSAVVGQISGPISNVGGFTLFKTQDPLLDGESTIASDYVEVAQVDGIPGGDPIQVNGEEHVLIGQIEEPLLSVGVNTFTLRVYSQLRDVLYNGPDTANPDYLIVGGSQTKAIRLVRTAASNIPSGATVSVDYEHDENFVVTYVVNDVLQRVQSRIAKTRHATADVIVKQAIENPLLIQATVQLKAGSTQSAVDNDARTNYSVMIGNKDVGAGVHQSDVVAALENTAGVDFVAQPFAKMTLLDGALRVRDPIPGAGVMIPSLSRGTAAVYALSQPLPFATSDGGGPVNVHRGVFIDDQAMKLVASMDSVGDAIGNAWIIGRGGAVVPGYSDDDTLRPEFVTDAAIAAERLRRTSNKVLVSLDFGVGDVPTNHSFSVSYAVDGDAGAKDVATSQIEYLTPGDVTLTFRSAEA